jgi:hypothetical protein
MVTGVMGILAPARFTRFWAKVDTSAGPGGCWRWRGTHNQAKGTKRKEWTANSRRPRFRISAGRGKGTHMYVAPLMLAVMDPAGYAIARQHNLKACHSPGTCTHDWCINPMHMYWGTDEDNVQDRYPNRRQE